MGLPVRSSELRLVPTAIRADVSRRLADCPQDDVVGATPQHGEAPVLAGGDLSREGLGKLVDEVSIDERRTEERVGMLPAQQQQGSAEHPRDAGGHAARSSVVKVVEEKMHAGRL